MEPKIRVDVLLRWVHRLWMLDILDDVAYDHISDILTERMEEQ